MQLETITALLKEIAFASVDLGWQMSPYLIFGLSVAAILHLLVPVSIVTKHLGGSRIRDLFKAIIIGTPLPLCSCSVIPTLVTL